MLPLSPSPFDVRLVSRVDQPKAVAFERERLRRERQDLLEHNRRLNDENERLLEENRALREAAAMWIRLYERQLARANEAARFSSVLEKASGR
jgi:hypothetical protein